MENNFYIVFLTNKKISNIPQELKLFYIERGANNYFNELSIKASVDISIHKIKLSLENFDALNDFNFSKKQYDLIFKSYKKKLKSLNNE